MYGAGPTSRGFVFSAISHAAVLEGILSKDDDFREENEKRDENSDAMVDCQWEEAFVYVLFVVSIRGAYQSELDSW